MPRRHSKRKNPQSLYLIWPKADHAFWACSHAVPNLRRAFSLQVITIHPRYLLFNNSEEGLQYGQRGTSLVWQLSPGTRAPFHWDDADGRFELCVRPAIGKWKWSGAFQASFEKLHIPSYAISLMLAKSWNIMARYEFSSFFSIVFKQSEMFILLSFLPCFGSSGNYWRTLHRNLLHAICELRSRPLAKLTYQLIWIFEMHSQCTFNAFLLLLFSTH